MDTKNQPVTTIDSDTATNNLLGHPFNVILFNDSVHEMLEVSAQIQKATHCSAERAISVMYEAHTNGRAVVFTGSKERCEHVDSILAGPPCQLMTAIEAA
jgi:ATP-dependent Clp protease adapter protein ClpS